jgi:hypothetical protein
LDTIMTSKNNADGRRHPNLDDRQAAERKLCRLFDSFGINAADARDRLIDPFIDRAIQFWRGHVGPDLAVLAFDEAEFDLRAWFVEILGDEEAIGDSPVMIGRAAFLMCGGPERWSTWLLSPVAGLPAEFLDDLRAHVTTAVPPSDIGEMDHQPYESWSIPNMVARALPLDQRLIQGFGSLIRGSSIRGSLIRRDGRSLSFGWRDIGPTS